jgi:hypothetical protein
MGYMHIENLYKNRDILAFRECYALEKIHGTSAHIRWENGAIGYFAGGAKHDAFIALFDESELAAKFTALGHQHVVIYGEAYGGKLQGMSATYGKQLRFVAFDVLIGKTWLAVPDAYEVATELGLDFVHYERISATIAAIDAQRDAPSEQAVKVGIDEYRKREGVVLRPLFETTKSNGERIIAKHKREDFQERKNQPSADAAKLAVLSEAQTIADEWVTHMRLSHVLDRMGNPTDFAAIPDVIKAMLEDVTREAAGEIVDSKEARRVIGSKTVAMYKARIAESLMPPDRTWIINRGLTKHPSSPTANANTTGR